MLISRLTPRHLLIALLLLPLLAAVGCSSSNKLLREPGTFAYEGDSIKAHGTMVENWIMGYEQNIIDVEAAQNPRDNYEPVAVFVEEARLNELDENASTLSTAQLTLKVNQAACEAVSSFGRFERTTDRNKAHIILIPTLYSINAWADTKLSNEEVRSSYGNIGDQISRSVAADINREAIDAFVSVILARGPADPTGDAGNEWGSARALGRRIANQGQAIDTANYSVAGAHGGGSSYLKATHAKLKDSELSLSIRKGIEGALADIITKPKFDTRVWAAVAPASAQRSHLLRPRSVAGAPGASPN